MKKLVYLGLGLTLTVAGMVSAARPAQAAGNCTTSCSPSQCCVSCCVVDGARHCGEIFCL
jgi:hypothetical protein